MVQTSYIKDVLGKQLQFLIINGSALIIVIYSLLLPYFILNLFYLSLSPIWGFNLFYFGSACWTPIHEIVHSLNKPLFDLSLDTTRAVYVFTRYQNTLILSQNRSGQTYTANSRINFPLFLTCIFVNPLLLSDFTPSSFSNSFVSLVFVFQVGVIFVVF